MFLALTILVVLAAASAVGVLCGWYLSDGGHSPFWIFPLAVYYVAALRAGFLLWEAIL